MKLKRVLAIDGLESRILIVGTTVAIIFSVVSNVINIPVGWQIPFVFLTLFASLRILSAAHRDGCATLEVVKDIHKRLDPISVDYYPTNASYYSSAKKAAIKTQFSIDATYIRRVPPSLFKGEEARAYFDDLLNWARSRPSGHLFRRIIAIPNECMLQWARIHHEETKDIANYEARVIEWHIQADCLNMAIFDEGTSNASVFLVFSGETDQDMRGISIADERAAAYFRRYYQQLWQSAEPLSELLCRHDNAASASP